MDEPQPQKQFIPLRLVSRHEDGLFAATAALEARVRAILEQLLEEGVIDSYDIADDGERLTVTIQTKHSTSVVRSHFRAAQGDQAAETAVVFVHRKPAPSVKRQLSRV
jgi:hypothetical protein